MDMFRKAVVVGAFLTAAMGCANTIRKPISAGNETLIMTAQAKPSPFGVASAVNMGRLIQEASDSCTDRGLKFLLLDQQQNEGSAVKLGNGSVTYRCGE